MRSQDPADRTHPMSPQIPVNLNQIVAYNLRAARKLRGWTQGELAARVEPFLNTRPSQATISALERSWDPTRPHREFDVQHIAAFAAALDVPIVWFFLPPPGDRRAVQGLGRTLDQLYVLLLGRDDQLEPIYERLRRRDIHNPAPQGNDKEVGAGVQSSNREQGYRQRRADLLLAMLDESEQHLNKAVEQLATLFAHLRDLGDAGLLTSKDRGDSLSPA